MFIKPLVLLLNELYVLTHIACIIFMISFLNGFKKENIINNSPLGKKKKKSILRRLWMIWFSLTVIFLKIIKPLFDKHTFLLLNATVLQCIVLNLLQTCTLRESVQKANSLILS